MKDVQIPTTKAAELCGVTERRIRQLIDEGKLPADTGGTVPLVGTLTGFIAHQRTYRGDELTTARLKKLHAETSLKEAELAAVRKQTMPQAAVATIVRKIADIVTSSVDFALLTRLPVMNAGLDAAQQIANNEPEANEIRRRIRDEAQAFLKGLEQSTEGAQ